MNKREDELWRLIRFDKDATVDQMRLWCKELNEILSRSEIDELERKEARSVVIAK